MTLAVCRISGRSLILLSDTRISNNDMTVKPQAGAIKTVLLSSEAAVAFSNSPELAARDINRFHDEFGCNFSFMQAVDYFSLSSLRTGNEYILAFRRPLRVTTIKNGSSEKLIGAQTWIGDIDAFKRLRAYQLKEKRGPDEWHAWYGPKMRDRKAERLLDLRQDFELTLLDRDIPSAGDFYQAVMNCHGGFRFMPQAKLRYDSLQGLPASPLSGENFDYRFSTVVALHPGGNGIGFYYPTGQTGYIFYPKGEGIVCDSCHVSSAPTIEQFCHEWSKFNGGVEYDYMTTFHPRPV